MKINLKQNLFNLEGKKLKEDELEVTVGSVLASMLGNSTESTDPLRDYVLAKKLMEAKGELEIDASEVSHLKETITKAPNYLVLVKGQLLEKFVN